MEPKERFAAFLLYVDDWLSATEIDLMTAGEERGYLRLLLHSWKSPDCGLPDDDRILAQLSKLGSAWKGKGGAALRAQFTARDGRLFNERLLRERTYQVERRQSRQKASQKGNLARWASAKDPSAIPSGVPTESQNDPNPNPNPNSKETPTRIEVCGILNPEKIEAAQKAIGAHRGRGDEPDATITRKILQVFDTVEGFDTWIADIGTGLDPAEITGEGWALYLTDAQRWIENGCRRPKVPRLPKADADMKQRVRELLKARKEKS